MAASSPHMINPTILTLAAASPRITNSSQIGSPRFTGSSPLPIAQRRATAALRSIEYAQIAHHQTPGHPSNLATPRTCKCRKSKCLKLYCECFAAHVYCTPSVCGCVECVNLSAHESVRVAAIETALVRNVDAFVYKVTKATKRSNMTVSAGCSCRKSLCLKKYCECFYTNNKCGESCECKDCENYEGSGKLEETQRALQARGRKEMEANMKKERAAVTLLA